MISSFNRKFFPLGLVLFAITLNFYKAFVLNVSMGATWRTFLCLLCVDLFFISLLMFIALFQAWLKPGLLRNCVWLVLILAISVYLVDSFVLLAVDDHAALFDIGRYTPEWGIVLSFFDAMAYGAIFFLLASLFLVRPPTSRMKKYGTLVLAGFFSGSLLSASFIPPPLQRYAFLNPVELWGSLERRPVLASYSIEQIDFYAGLKRGQVVIPKSKPDIILLVMESLSSINSMRVSGSGNLLKRFDQLADEGLLFTNFMANHQASEGGMIALLSGYPPMHFPTATPYMFDEFANQHSVIAEYQEQGYHTEFLTNSDLSFIGLNRYLEGLGFDRSRGRDEVATMREAPRIVQDAPADNFLFDEALLTLRNRETGQKPMLLVLATTSTHLPPVHPQDGPDTHEAIWDWSLQQLALFYQRLHEQGYFDHGILLVTGDHRQMRPLTGVETDRYGASARARVPLLVIGNEWPQGEIDPRFFQQSDLLRMLGHIHDPERSLSPLVIWVERYNRKYGQVEHIDSLSVFDEASDGRVEYPLRVLGSQIEWLQKKPVFARGVENRIHSQRSLHQQMRNGAVKRCVPDWEDKNLVASSLPGLEMGFFDQESLDGVMDLYALPGKKRALVESVVAREVPGPDTVGSILYAGFLDVSEAGVYRFRVGKGLTACLSLDQTLVLDQRSDSMAAHEISVQLSAGEHFLDLRFSGNPQQLKPRLEWITPGSRQWWWKPVPAERFHHRVQAH